MDWILSLWDSVMNPGIAEIGIIAYAMFILIFIVIPVCVFILTFKVIKFLASCLFGE